MEELTDFLISITKDIPSNKEIFDKYLKDGKYIDKCNKNLMHMMLEVKCNMIQKLYAIPTLVDNGVNINHKNYFEDNYIQTAMRLGYSTEDIVKLLSVGCACGFDINGVNKLKQNLFHTFIRLNKSYDDIAALLFNLLNNEKFNFKAKDDVGNNVIVYIVCRDDIPDIYKKFLIDVIYDEIINRDKKKNNVNSNRKTYKKIISFDDYLKKENR